MSRLLTTREVAEALGVEPASVRNWVKAKRLIPKVVTPGGHARFDLDEVKRALAPAEAAPQNGEEDE